ncbi:oxidoreductase [Cladophialophora psammophila CBS 110553]|uniref:Oxidoreductase n=1 Tax=Cladophialophora psammophila CBS 110553 TaxID=1182543 RepID=W9XC46_9EURO|nr:oxidoreductase [Cladophialophora psammophila CBS 110553]EXJ74496.1 oxidoreductase [Cladophialophora psammophila CBS 110553]
MAQASAWYDAYPKPRTQSPATLSRQELLQWLQDGKKPGADFLLVDLRRTDHEGGTIKGSINLPAQSLYHSLPTLLTLCQNAGVRTVIWYCGSSRGRGTRAAGWFQDLIEDKQVPNITSAILADGITGWARAGEEYTSLMEQYHPEHWLKEK